MTGRRKKALILTDILLGGLLICSGCKVLVNSGGDVEEFEGHSVTRHNSLSEVEKAGGWILLFDGTTLDGWMTSAGKPSARPVERSCLNPHRSGDYMLVHRRRLGDFTLSLDFNIDPGKDRPVKNRTYNSGIFFRVATLDVRPGLDVGYNGLEIAVDHVPTDPTRAGYHDTGAIYDLVKPAHNAMKPPGEWNRVVLSCDGNLITVEVNGQLVTRMDLEEWTEKNRRPDDTEHKFDIAYRDHPREGYIGLQDHGCDIRFRNLKLKPLER